MCGEPDDAQHSIETRTIPQRVLVPCATGQAGLCEAVVYQTIQITVDRWTYDFGSNRFIEFAAFDKAPWSTSRPDPTAKKDPT